MNVFRAGQYGRRATMALAAGSLMLSFGCGAADEHGAHAGDHEDHAAAPADEHASHASHEMNTARDAEGRRLFGHSHVMPEAMYEELRENIPLYEDATKAQIDLSMVQMGGDYEWYISPAGLENDAGVLILSHGFREQGDKMFKRELEPLAEALPTALALGMAMMMSDHVQLAIDDLEAAGAERIVIVPATSTRYNELMRQWEYVVGERDEPQFATVGQVESEAKLLLADPPEDDPLIANILIDHAAEISTDPANEVVFVVAHGASGVNAAQDNVKEMQILENLAKIIREDGGFAGSGAFVLQDDAPPEIRKANVERLRNAVEKETKAGRTVLVVTNLIGARTIQPKLRSDLKGLDYKFSVKGIAQHPNFITWIGEAVREELEKAGST